MAFDSHNIKGIIFDMDGVLVDSEPAMAHASVIGMAKHGIYAKDEDFYPYFGTDEKTYFGSVFEKYGGKYTPEIAEEIYDIYCETAPDVISIFPGVAETFKKLHNMGYKLAIASSSIKRKLDVNIDSTKIDKNLLDAIVCGSDVVKRKPDPEIFLKAADKLGLSPLNCLVAEDAISGVTAAKAADMYCFGVTTTFSGDKLKEIGADITGSSISEIINYL